MWNRLLGDTFCYLFYFCDDYIFWMQSSPYPSGVYSGEYIANQMDYNANNNKESLVEANKNWNMYLKTRIRE